MIGMEILHGIMLIKLSCPVKKKTLDETVAIFNRKINTENQIGNKKSIYTQLTDIGSKEYLNRLIILIFLQVHLQKFFQQQKCITLLANVRYILIIILN